MEELPPPPPPRGKSTNPDENQEEIIFQALNDLGYNVKDISPWKLVAVLLKDVANFKEKIESERTRFEKDLEDEKKKTEALEENNLVLIEELAKKVREDQNLFQDIPSKYSGKENTLHKEIQRLRAALKASQEECNRLTSIATFATLKKGTVPVEETRISEDHKKQQESIIQFKAFHEEEISKLNDVIDELKLNLVKMQTEKDGLLYKIELLNTGLEKETKARSNVEEAMKHCREETKLATEMLQEERRSRKLEKVKMDEMEKQIEILRKDLLAHQKKYQIIEKEKIQLETQLNPMKRQLMLKTDELASKEDDIRSQLARIQNLENLIENERVAHSSRLQEIRAASLDVANMTRDNRELSLQVEKLNRELREIKSILEETISKNERLNGILDSKELERTELLAIYRKVTLENEQLQTEMKDLAALRASYLKEEKSIHETNVVLTQRNVELEDILRKQRLDLQSYEQKIDSISRELRVARAKCQDLENNAELTSRQFENEKQKFVQTSKSQEKMLWDLSQTKAELEKCINNYHQSLEVNDRMASELAEERRKLRDLEIQLERARIGQAQALISSGKILTEKTKTVSAQSALQNTKTSSFVDLAEQPTLPFNTNKTSKTSMTSKSLLEESDSSTISNLDERYSELAKDIRDDLSEASSIIKQSREERTKTPPSRILTPSGIMKSSRPDSS